MVKRKSVCGLCKPTKKWKKNDTKLKNEINKIIFEELKINGYSDK